MTFDFNSASTLDGLLQLTKLERPSALVKGLEVAATIDRLRHLPQPNLLEMDDAGMRQYLEARTIRQAGFSQTPNGTNTAWQHVRVHVVDELFNDVREAILPELDELIDQIRTPFDALGSKLTRCVSEYGFTAYTSSDEVIRLNDDLALAAWREVPTIIEMLQPYAAIRQLLTTSLDLSPTAAERQRVSNPGWIPNDFSVLFATGDGWSVNGGAHLNGNPKMSLDWLGLARTGVAMNGTDTVRVKVVERMRSLVSLATVSGSYQNVDGD